MKMTAWILPLALGLEMALADILVTGATGRTGSALYNALKATQPEPVRALVRNATKARDVLGCKKCDASEGIFEGDVTQISTLSAAFHGVTRLAIAVGVYGTESEKIVKEVEWLGVKNQVESLLRDGAGGRHVLLISSIGTTTPPESNSSKVLFYKLLAESYIASAGVPFSIIKPCGLADAPGGDRSFLLSHDDADFSKWMSEGTIMIPRADVAAVAAEAMIREPASTMRFDLCAKAAGTGPPQPLQAVLKAALYPWQRSERSMLV
mmetsp:Transcript_37823/g.87563  ORF Transcript_37823/g.87563 Transcript_37823/m.87563 type:complete len:266 (+) Transcript_37823:47-844(+)